MSKVSRSWWPDCSATQTAPVTPPAGPDSSIVTGAPMAAVGRGQAAVAAQDGQSPRGPRPRASWSLRLAEVALATCGWT